jgi:protein-disulfide isomerase
MSPATSDKRIYDGMSKKDRQALSRELARIRREEEQKRRRRNRVIAIVIAVVAVVAILAGAGWAVYSAVRASFVGPLNMLSDGVILTGSGSAVTATSTDAIQPGEQPVASELDTATVLRLTEYVDYGSADVGTFETTNGSALQSYVSAGYASLELHPVALEGPDSYSARAANTIACVANTLPDAVLPIHNALIAKIADLPDGGLSNDELATLVSDAGVTDESVGSCIRGNEFSDWVTDATSRAQASVPNSDVESLEKVPLLVVDGIAYTGALDDADALSTFITDTYTAVATPPATDGAEGGDAGTAPTDGTAPADGTVPTDGSVPAPTNTTTPIG